MSWMIFDQEFAASVGTLGDYKAFFNSHEQDISRPVFCKNFNVNASSLGVFVFNRGIYTLGIRYFKPVKISNKSLEEYL